MKKVLPILLGSMVLALTACGGGDEEATKPVSPEQSETQGPTDDRLVVNKVTITGANQTTVLDGQTMKLKATVDANKGGLKVSWESSNSKLATVVNGVVKFGSVTSDSKVTIRAVSKDDTTKFDEVEFTIKHSVIDLNNSRGTDLDTSLFIDNGEIIVQPGDTAIKLADVYGTKWYVEGSITIDTLSENDDFPKFGIMSGSEEAGYWNGSTEDKTVKNVFFYLDSVRSQQASGWNVFNFVGQNKAYSDWGWSEQKGSFTYEKKVELGAPVKMGLMRDGCNYYLFVENEGQMKCYKHVYYDRIAADEPTYAWIGGWNTGATVSNVRAVVDKGIEELYGEPTKLNTISSTTLFINEEQKIDVSTDVINYDKSKLTYKSSDENVCTVSADGVITAGASRGNAKVIVSYGEISTTIEVTVTDDKLFNVVLDGKMDDLIWSDTVKQNKLVFNREDGEVLIDVYASRNSNGIYFFIDYKSVDDGSNAANWWEGNNFEMRLTSTEGFINNKREVENNTGNPTQYWASSYAGGDSNFTKHFISAPKLNEESGKYEIQFEMFVSYADATINENERCGFTIGSNDMAKRWYESKNWNKKDLVLNYKITQNGILEYYPESECENHEYGEWVIIKQASCKDDGLKERVCKWCNHKDTEVILKGEHSFDESKVIVDIPATCVAPGKGHLECLGGCGEIKEVVIPVDPNNHVAWNEATHICDECKSLIKDAIDYNRKWDSAGWNGKENWAMIAEGLTGDFEYKTTFTMNKNGNDWWRGVLFGVRESLEENKNGSVWIQRHDWWGWVDQEASADKLGRYDNTPDFRTQDWFKEHDANADGTLFEAVTAHCNVEWTCKRVGTTITHEIVYTALDGDIAGTKFHYTAKLLDVEASKKVDLFLTAEFAKGLVTKIEKIA